MAEGGSSGAVDVSDSEYFCPEEEVTLSDDELMAILRRQLHGRNREFSSPAFKQRLAEDIIVQRMGEFRVGDHLFEGFFEEESDFVCTCGASSDSCGEITIPLLTKECACQDFDRLTIQAIHPSGSKREGNDVRLNGAHDWSDVDVMIQLGPIRIMGDIVPSSATSKAPPDQRREMTEPTSLPKDVMVLRLEPTDQPGFVLLRYQPRPDCQHGEPLLFPAVQVRNSIKDISELDKTKPRKTYHFKILHNTSGPAVSSQVEGLAADLVPCILLPHWPSDEYRSRRRPTLQPPAELVERLCRVPAMVVPVGFGDGTLRYESWRLSFSRHEYMLLHALTDLQRDCLWVLKYCSALLFGPHGDVKGAYLKTALLWVCEETTPDTWEKHGLRSMALRVLSRLQMCVQQRNLPCYFWPKINMLASRSDDDLSRLDRALRNLNAHLMTAAAAVVAIFVKYNDSVVSDHRLPGRGRSKLWEFVLKRAQTVDPGNGLGEDTWLTRQNFYSLLFKSSPVTSAYQRVLAAMRDDTSQSADDRQIEDDWLTGE